jgi:hypothetical protein
MAAGWLSAVAGGIAERIPLVAKVSTRYTTGARSGAESCQPTSGADGSLYVTCGTDSPNLPRVGGI